MPPIIYLPHRIYIYVGSTTRPTTAQAASTRATPPTTSVSIHALFVILYN